MIERPKFLHQFLRTEKLDPTLFVEPSDGTLRDTPWGAMPANPYVDEALKASQAVKDVEFHKLFEYPPSDVPPEFAHMLLVDYEIGEARRKLQNYRGYGAWLGKHQPISPEIDEKMAMFERGKASPYETLDIAMNTIIPHFEVGKVTSPYGQRLEYVSPFREEVAEAVEAHGGVVYPKVFPYRSITIVPSVDYHNDGSHTLNGFIVRYKRDFGHINHPDGKTVIRLVERQMAGIRVDPASGFFDAAALMMKYVPISEERPWEQNYEQYVVQTGAEGFITRAVQVDSSEPFFVPISTTIYGYKTKAESVPGKMLGQRAAQGVLVGDLLYYGPDFNDKS